ncbi:MAG: GIY-YIG nuclease family protein [Hymenobacteraceae bacterium]|nr:GIY-YIG nuclease family protein [Hymenobacteraceae bacterium]MDX5396789.1 GIY-YIG nuclease family protein [Hymenobacteraceae bacterium]MDX5442402.1 GIY-YIG nuclease family protein [Hymenobacteraceae bacterium]MDX5512852.1 GIY-YIG nuclease family protein [Hymenobacteraceae bacterium]
MDSGNYFTYIITNKNSTTLYIGVTNNLELRLKQHKQNSGNPKTFAGRYNCYYLIYFERFSAATHAIEREKELKSWNRSKKESLIKSFNPDWKFLNNEVTEL